MTNWACEQRLVTQCDATDVHAFRRTLSLDSNQLSGTIPSTLGNLSALQ